MPQRQQQPLLRSLPPPSWRGSLDPGPAPQDQGPESPGPPLDRRDAPELPGQPLGQQVHDQAAPQGDSQAQPSAEEAAGCSR
jgi:hypothetical protein